MAPAFVKSISTDVGQEMKTTRSNFRKTIILILMLTLGLPGCGGSDSGSNSGLGAVVCVITLGFICSGRDAQAEVDGLPEKVRSPSATVPTTAVAPEIALDWEAASSDSPVSGYRIYRDGSLIADTARPGFTDSALDPDTRYCYSVTAYDESLNESAHSDAACATTSWITTTIDTDILVPRPALALDFLDEVRFAYLGTDREGKRNITFAKLQDGAWTREDLGPAPASFSANIAIGIEADGTAHVGSAEQHATNRSGSWQLATREGHNFSAFALDSHGFIHGVGAATGGDFNHVTDTGGGWTMERIGDGEWQWLALAIDKFDGLHIAYYNYEARELRYLSNSLGSWATEVIASGVGPLWRLDLAVDGSGRAHLTYRSNADRLGLPENSDSGNYSSLVYASNPDGRWQLEVLDHGDGVGGRSAITADADGYLHISYSGRGGDELRYLTNASGSWESTVIDDGMLAGYDCGMTADICGSTDIAVDASGKVHIGYHDADRVLYATNASHQ